MPTPTIDLKPFQALITTWFNDDITVDDIAKRLADEYNTICTGRTICSEPPVYSYHRYMGRPVYLRHRPFEPSIPPLIKFMA